jgi:hypothetical protein
MDNKTIKLLSKYDLHKKIINISEKNIQGILDLEKFKQLEELDCSSNEITELINIPNTLKYLNCSSNKIKSLLDLPNDLTGLNCKYNPLTKLYYPFETKPKKYPTNLTYLEFGYKFNDNVNNLPKKLIGIVFGNDFIQTIDNLPNTIKIIEFKAYQECQYPITLFDKHIDSLPNSLEKLILSSMFNHPVNNLPNSLVYLSFGYNFNQNLDNLPINLKYLEFRSVYTSRYQESSKFNHPLMNLPKKLETINFSYLSEFNQPLDNLPDSIRELTLGFGFNQQVNYLPNNIIKIEITDDKQKMLFDYKYHSLLS